ncbi:MAG: hypothetical protein QHI38_12350 [Armatimonadota bacterium]|nr:hypothetical protein [Armatimonadota bacterium]
MKKVVILMCTCSGACPSMEKINFWDLAERIRLELPHDYIVMHPRLCEENGEALMADLLKPDAVYVTPACDEKKQIKLLASGFARAGVPMDEAHWVPVRMGLRNTDEVFEAIKEVIEKIQASGAQ